MSDDIQFFDAPHGARLAFRRSSGRGPGLVWLGGFRSDMEGGKATALHDWAQGQGRGFLRFDYRGHGASSGSFEDGAISDWLDDALSVIDGLTDGPQILIGSSMGAWIALLAALRRPERLAGMLLLAPAPDFTETLMKPNLPEEAREAIARDGVWRQPSPYDPEPTPITARLLEDGAQHCLLTGAPIAIHAPVLILQGMQDPDVPWRHALTLFEALGGENARLTLIKDGDHRLSRENDIQMIIETASSLVSDSQA